MMQLFARCEFYEHIWEGMWKHRHIALLAPRWRHTSHVTVRVYVGIVQEVHFFSELPGKDFSRASYPNPNSLELMHHIMTEFSSKIFQFNPRDSMMDHTQSNLYHSCLTNYSTIQIEIAEHRSCINISTIQHHAYPFSHFSPSTCR